MGNNNQSNQPPNQTDAAKADAAKAESAKAEAAKAEAAKAEAEKAETAKAQAAREALATETRTFRTRRTLFINGYGKVVNGGTCELTYDQWEANKNSLIEVGSPADDSNRADMDMVER